MASGIGPSHPPSGGGASSSSSSSSSLPARMGAVVSASLPAPAGLPAGEMSISTVQSSNPKLYAVCQGLLLSVTQEGKQGVVVTHKMPLDDVASIVIKMCACQVPPIDPESVTTISMKFQDEKLKLGYKDEHGVDKVLDLNLTKELKTQPEAEKIFRKLQAETQKIPEFKGRISNVELVTNARSAFVKTGSIGSHAATDITKPMGLLKIASQTGFLRKSDSAESTYLKSKIQAVTGQSITTSPVTQLKEVKARRKKILTELAKLIDDKKQELARAANQADKDRLSQVVSDLEKLEDFIAIQPREKLAGEDPEKAVEAHIDACKDFGMDLKVAIALAMDQARQMKGAPLTQTEKVELAKELEKLFLGRKTQSAWERFKESRFGISPSAHPAVDSAIYPRGATKFEKIEMAQSFKQSAKQMAADTVALLFNHEQDAPAGSSVKDAYQEFSQLLGTTNQSRDVADVMFSTHNKTPQERCDEYLSALNLNPDAALKAELERSVFAA